MSIVNVFVSPEVALVGVDTEGMLPDGSCIEGCKMIFLPHLSAVVAFRGLDITFACAAPRIMGFVGGFDDMADAMGKIIEGARRIARDQAVALARTQDDADSANFVLVGYSPSARRMVGHAFDCLSGGAGIRELRDFPQLYGPFFGEDEIRKLNVKADRDGMVALALDQCRLVRERGPAGMPAGGRFFITEVSKDRISVELAFHFPAR